MQVPRNAVLLRIFIGEDDRFSHQPLHEAIVLKAMSVDPAQRFQSMEALGKSLVPLLKQSTR